MATQPFNAPRDNGGSVSHSFSVSASYLRPNIAVPPRSAGGTKTAAQHATQADSDFEDRLPVLATVTAIATPATGA